MSGHVDACIGDQDRDIKTGTCSMSVYKRRGPSTLPGLPLPSEAVPIPDTNWRGGNGIAGGWDQMLNGDCAFLSGGEQRNWWFSGEESWDFPVAKAIVEDQAGGPGAVQEAGETVKANI